MSELSASQDFYKNFVETSVSGIWMVDLAGTVQFVNPKLAQKLGYEVSEMVGKPFLRFVAEEHAELQFQQNEDFEIKLVRKSGEEVLLQVSPSPMFSPTNERVGSAAFIREVSQFSKKRERIVQERTESLLRVHSELKTEKLERRQLEDVLSRTQRELRSFFESAPLYMGIIEHAEADLRYIMTNSQMSDFLGLGANGMDGKYASELGVSPIIIQEFLVRSRQSKETGQVIKWEYTSLRFESPRIFNSRVNYVGLSPEGQDRYSIAIEEITEIREFERKKEEQASKLSYLSKMSALGEMASGIAHEIYNPLAIVKGYADLLEKKTMKGAVESKELLQISSEIQSTSRRITEIVEGLRFFAREGTHDPMELTTVQSIVNATLKICSERFRKYGVELKVIHHDANLTVACRDVQISQVILNFLNNAFDSVTNEDFKQVTLETELHDETVYIRVSDSGKGVAEMLKSKIFEPFFTTKAIGLGTGMGLSICKGIMDTHFGSIDLIASSHGACFQLSLPQGHADVDPRRVDQ
jgi:PAS domain S-box-containing protein